MAKKKFQQTYVYQCSISEESFVVTEEAPNPKELVSVKAYYELNPDKDDRPEDIKKQLE